MSKYSMTTQTQVRVAFWEAHPQYVSEFKASKRQDDYRVDIRVAFVDYVDMLQKDGTISDKLASRIIL